MRTIEPARSYNAKFYRELEAAQQSSVEVLPIIFEVLRPSRVVDVGCGTGHWLATARDLGAKEILGIDGPWVEKEQLVIPAENFRIEDLTRPLKLDRRFDLALCFEVAEHLPESKAHTFVKTLCETADVVAFSAAIPGQGGRRHLNEQWPAYWADLFRELEYDCYDYLRPRIWNNPRVTWYYAQNSLIFAKRGSSSEFGASVRPWAMVHPGLWSAEVARMKHPGKLLERFVKSVLRRATSDNKRIL
ncbi:MAG TPA: methyltransferase domain-containing protein [Terriglobales bacterium]|jgi:SAM-dependent methyltransferase